MIIHTTDELEKMCVEELDDYIAELMSWLDTYFCTIDDIIREKEDND